MLSETAAPAVPLPEVTETTRPYYDALAAKELHYQRCSSCGYSWLPARADCPDCLRPHAEWLRASGDATLVSWVTYRLAVHPAFADRVPYSVGVIELAEGPRMISMLDADPEQLQIGLAMTALFLEEQCFPVVHFAPASDAQA